jgi:hypothetical protein
MLIDEIRITNKYRMNVIFEAKYALIFSMVRYLYQPMPFLALQDG